MKHSKDWDVRRVINGDALTLTQEWQGQTATISIRRWATCATSEEEESGARRREFSGRGTNDENSSWESSMCMARHEA